MGKVGYAELRKVTAESNKAARVQLMLSGAEVWLPKSAVAWATVGNRGYVQVPQWLAENKGAELQPHLPEGAEFLDPYDAVSVMRCHLARLYPARFRIRQLLGWVEHRGYTLRVARIMGNYGQSGVVSGTDQYGEQMSYGDLVELGLAFFSDRPRVVNISEAASDAQAFAEVEQVAKAKIDRHLDGAPEPTVGHFEL